MPCMSLFQRKMELEEDMELVQWQVEVENKFPGQWDKYDWAHNAL